jgi:hypothetical protein
VRLAGTLVGLLGAFLCYFYPRWFVDERLDSWHGSMVYWCWKWGWESVWDRDRHRQSWSSSLERWVMIDFVWVLQTIFIAPIFFCRLAAPPQQLLFWTMIGITLVLGLSSF